MVMITFLLNALCQGGLSIISWFIVFIPFILMSVIVTMLLYVFGLDVATGKLNYNCQNVQAQNKTVVISTQEQPQFPVKVFNPNYNINPYPVNYNIPTAAEVNNYNNIAPVNQTQSQTQQQPPAVQATIFAPNYSSSPEYTS